MCIPNLRFNIDIYLDLMLTISKPVIENVEINLNANPVDAKKFSIHPFIIIEIAYLICNFSIIWLMNLI